RSRQRSVIGMRNRAARLSRLMGVALAVRVVRSVCGLSARRRQRAGVFFVAFFVAAFFAVAFFAAGLSAAGASAAGFFVGVVVAPGVMPSTGARKRPVCEYGSEAMCSGVPSATM